MAILARHSFRNQDLSQEKAAALRGLERGTWQRGVWLLVFVLTGPHYYSANHCR